MIRFAPVPGGMRSRLRNAERPDADLQALDIFPKMWKNPDPSVIYLMSQSAPLMIPSRPNCTLRARVVA